MSGKEIVAFGDVATVSAVGIDAKRELSLSEWEEMASWVSRVDTGRAWILGDLYNLWPEGRAGRAGDDDSRRAKCEELGLNYGTMKNNGIVSRIFDNRSCRNDQLTFAHYQQLAIDELSEKQRQELIETALDHGTILSVKALAKERDKLLGRRDKTETLKSTEATKDLVQEVLEAIPDKTPAPVKKAIEREVKRAANTLSKSYLSEVKREADKQASKERERLGEVMKEVDRKRLLYQDLINKKFNGYDVKAGLRVLRQACHPDRQASKELRESAMHHIDKIAKILGF